jgi:glycosyltransferase involved in cell wall biosynthesis
VGLRIVHACPNFRPHLGGVESHVESLGRELARRGHEVTVLTASQPGAPARERIGGLAVERLERLASPLGTPVLRGLAQRVAALAPSLVHSHSPPPITAWQAARAARAAGVPHVLTHHCDLDIPRWWGPFAVEVYERTLHRQALASAALVVSTTQGYADTSRALWRMPEARVAVVPNPVDVDRFDPDLDPRAARAKLGLGEGPTALYVGRLAHHKGIEQFVEAARHTPAGVTHAIAGDGPERERLEALARTLGVATKVRFLGKVLHDALPWAYAACDVAVLPSVSRLEAFGIAALEAMASARPVVVSDIPGVREVVEPGVTGLTAKPLDPRDLAARIADLLADAPRRAAMGAAGRARVEERFATPKVCDALERAYARVLAR